MSAGETAHMDCPTCDGEGFVYCPGCQGARSVPAVLLYDGSFPLGFLRDDERVASAGDGSGACVIFREGREPMRVDIGETIVRWTDGSIARRRSVIDARADREGTNG